MDVREYSEGMRRVVKIVASGFKVSVDAGDLGCAMEAGLVTEPATEWYLTGKGRKLLRQMERDEKAAAQASRTVKHIPILLEFDDVVTGEHRRLECYHDCIVLDGKVSGYIGAGAFLHHFAINQTRLRCDDEATPNPEPLCPVCGKPAGEHRDGLWCCGHCGRGARMIDGGLFQARCTGARCGIAGLWYKHSESVRKDWNQRARHVALREAS